MRAGGPDYLSSVSNPTAATVNGAIEAVSTIIPTVVSAASEAELAGLFLNGQAAVSTRHTLADLGRPQNPTPLITDNSTALGITNRTVRLMRSKAIDMRYHWIRDRFDITDTSRTIARLRGCIVTIFYISRLHYLLYAH